MSTTRDQWLDEGMAMEEEKKRGTTSLRDSTRHSLNEHAQKNIPSYIANSLVKYLPSRTPRSSNADLLDVPSNSRKKIGDTAFVNYAPKLWNILPIDIREASLLNIFKRKLKTYFSP